MLARKIALNAAVSAFVRVIGTLVALATIGLITRYLGRDQWGEYSIVLTFGGIFTVLAELGLYQLLVRDISKPGSDEVKISSSLFTLRLLTSLFIFALAPLASLFFPYSAEARWGIALGSVGFWLMSAGQVLMGVFQKSLRMDRVGAAELAGRVVQFGLVFFFIKLSLGFFAIVGALSLSALINFVLMLWLVQNHIPIRLDFDLGFWKESLRQSYPLAVSGILTMIYFSSDSLFLSILKPAADVGIYRLSYKVLESLIFFPAMFVGLIMPPLTASVKNNWDRFRNIFQRSHDLLLITAIPMIAGTLFISPQIIKLLGGSLYPESIPVLNILIFAVAIIFLGTLLSFSIISLEKQKALLWISLAGSIFNVAANLIFIPRYSYYAAAAITVVTELLVTILMFWVLIKAVRFFPSFKAAGKSLLASLPMAAFLWQYNDFNLVIILPASILIYFAFLYLFKGISWADIKDLVFKKEAAAPPLS